ncbi:hypothetical protein LEL_02846 [Akanthomyces lecanii RCEF 1005]|uniref:Uncharacterized protein n=1 Tax=Akanthomyces lecanii RCEF 1005 TaxID=1081108 RepID=A0A168IK81_CORDF|nr:hypothetical protein LEL_02846 [Akanthomyces lecanii RCEF 1005]
MRCVTRNERCVGYRDENDLLFENETEKIVKRNLAVVQLADAAHLTWASTPSSASRSSAFSHRGRTRSLSPSRFTTSPSTTSSYYLDSEALPWTAERSAGPGLKDRGIATDVAVAHFFDRYVLYPCNDASTPGFLEHLPCLFKEVNVEGRQALRWAVKATALADLSRLEESTPEAAGAAFDCYGEALTALRESLSEKGKVPDDYDLMTVVVLDIFETLFMPDYVDDQSHAQGMAHILRLRGHGQFHDARSWGLFRLAHHRVQKQQLAKKMPPLPEARAWLDTFGGSDGMGRLERDGQSISALCHRARQLLTRISDRDAPSNAEILQLVLEMQQLDKEATLWRQTPEWSFSTVAKSADLRLPQELYLVLPDTLQLHRDIWMAYEWNYHRAARMILHGQLLQCLGETVSSMEAAQPSSGYPDELSLALELRMQMEVSVSTVQILADEVLGTVPQAFGDVDANGRPAEPDRLPGCRAIGAYLLLWPIKILKGKEAATSEAQKHAGSVVFERIRDCTGMKKNLGELSII